MQFTYACVCPLEQEPEILMSEWSIYFSGSFEPQRLIFPSIL